MEEIWKDIPQSEGEYQVSNLGRIKSLKRLVISKIGKRQTQDRILKPGLRKDGYLVITIQGKNKRSKAIHQFIAMAFLGHTPNGMAMQVNHIDGNKLNNNLANLEIVTARYNSADAYLRKQTSSKYTGVHWKKNRQKWSAVIVIGKKKHYLGYYKHEIDAANSYLRAVHKLN